ncbi:hypothetical protein ACFL27_04690 [candidate division CSSED10-310 bacterium]|uniref:Uncharacterized protein n=1 Tax=candidate division CSSED10-310 bacterium TaxID=2855610 RepID=A0ABV6YTF1_UNCC1
MDPQQYKSYHRRIDDSGNIRVQYLKKELSVSVESQKLLQQLLFVKPKLEEIMHTSRNEAEALVGLLNLATTGFADSSSGNSGTLLHRGHKMKRKENI